MSGDKIVRDSADNPEDLKEYLDNTIKMVGKSKTDPISDSDIFHPKKADKPDDGKNFSAVIPNDEQETAPERPLEDVVEVETETMQKKDLRFKKPKLNRSLDPKKPFYKRKSTYVIGGLGISAIAGTLLYGPILAKEIKDHFFTEYHLVVRRHRYQEFEVEYIPKTFVEKVKKAVSERTADLRNIFNTRPSSAYFNDVVDKGLSKVPHSKEALLPMLAIVYNHAKTLDRNTQINPAVFKSMVKNMNRKGYGSVANLKDFRYMSLTKSGLLKIALDNETKSKVNAFADIAVATSILKVKPIGKYGVRMAKRSGTAVLDVKGFDPVSIDTLWAYPFMDDGKPQWFAGVSGLQLEKNDKGLLSKTDKREYWGINASTMSKTSALFTFNKRKKFPVPYL